MIKSASQPKLRAVVICPGRGSYNKEQLGYLHQHHRSRSSHVSVIDQYLAANNAPTISELDSMPDFSFSTHTKGEHASPLIYGCAISDFHAIDRNQYDICAITGNSMGWYIALAAAQAVSEKDAVQLICTMGSMMKDQLIGGQVIYPVADNQWHVDIKQRAALLATIARINQHNDHQLYLSIDLGPFIVVAGNASGLAQFEQQVDSIDQYPMRLPNHGAFHTPMLTAIAAQAQTALPVGMFAAPQMPLIDGNGKIWSPYASNITELHRYTLNQQVCDPYYFTHCVDVALKEFAPDVFIVLGPGNSLGSSVASRLIKHNWHGIDNKDAFIERQKNNPIILSMGVAAQRQLVTIN